ncbi:MAG: hypothetical protein Q8P18_04615 [Pseudomonadota bacterium]|nr:hypothetical protein [Pseudomonadota bacterium]
MLDAFIIDRIRQHQNRPRESAQLPLRIEVPDPEQQAPRRDRDEIINKEERGIAIIDFTI